MVAADPAASKTEDAAAADSNPLSVSSTKTAGSNAGRFLLQAFIGDVDSGHACAASFLLPTPSPCPSPNGRGDPAVLKGGSPARPKTLQSLFAFLHHAPRFSDRVREREPEPVYRYPSSEAAMHAASARRESASFPQ